MAVHTADAQLLALRDLRLHQIELELQNDELRRVRLLLDAERASYVELYDIAPVGYLSLSESGIIVKANSVLFALERQIEAEDSVA